MRLNGSVTGESISGVLRRWGGIPHGQTGGSAHAGGWANNGDCPRGSTSGRATQEGRQAGVSHRQTVGHALAHGQMGR